MKQSSDKEMITILILYVAIKSPDFRLVPEGTVVIFSYLFISHMNGLTLRESLSCLRPQFLVA